VIFLYVVSVFSDFGTSALPRGKGQLAPFSDFVCTAYVHMCRARFFQQPLMETQPDTKEDVPPLLEQHHLLGLNEVSGLKSVEIDA
jgi:hypothetical protein